MKVNSTRKIFLLYLLNLLFKGGGLITCFFCYTEMATIEIYTLSLHDALPIFVGVGEGAEDLRVFRADEFVNALLER